MTWALARTCWADTTEHTQMPLSISDGALAWQRLAVVAAHPRDERIQFEEETHTYTIDGTRAGWTS